MPIYEYECDGCHQVFAVRQKMSDPAPTEHECGSRSVRRILSATSFVLKGTGWYKTDYADKPRPTEGGDERASDKPAGNESSNKDKAESKAAGGSDSGAGAATAPAAKAEPKPAGGSSTPSPKAGGKPQRA